MLILPSQTTPTHSVLSGGQGGHEFSTAREPHVYRLQILQISREFSNIMGGKTLRCVNNNRRTTLRTSDRSPSGSSKPSSWQILTYTAVVITSMICFAGCVQCTPNSRSMPYVYHTGYMAPTRQHALDHQESICLQRSNQSEID